MPLANFAYFLGELDRVCGDTDAFGRRTEINYRDLLGALRAYHLCYHSGRPDDHPDIIEGGGIPYRIMNNGCGPHSMPAAGAIVLLRDLNAIEFREIQDRFPHILIRPLRPDGISMMSDKANPEAKELITDFMGIMTPDDIRKHVPWRWTVYSAFGRWVHSEVEEFDQRLYKKVLHDTEQLSAMEV